MKWINSKMLMRTQATAYVLSSPLSESTMARADRLREGPVSKYIKTHSAIPLS